MYDGLTEARMPREIRARDVPPEVVRAGQTYTIDVTDYIHKLNP